MHRFDGATFDEELDGGRLNKQFSRINQFMKDGKWHTLREISKATGAPEASASAQLRNLRKDRFGAHKVNRRRRDNPAKGLFEYQVEWKFHGGK